MADLLGRWSAPLDCGIDQLSLRGGHKLSVPFDVTLVLATNLAPQQLLDDTLMRRIGYKIHVGALGEPGYRTLFRRQCQQAGMEYQDEVVTYLIEHLHAPSRRAMLASCPAELLGRITDFASYHGHAPRLTIGALEQAWVSMFGDCAGMAAPTEHALMFPAQPGDPLAEKIS
jgi:hypothetical protein